MHKSPYIQTYTGKRVYLFDLSPEMICIEDIAHALSNQCRFSGHVPCFYSVAEHSIRVAERAQVLSGDLTWRADTAHTTHSTARQALLHDASEAYIVDIPRPIKRAPEFTFYRAVEKQLQVFIYERFGLPAQDSDWCKLADMELLRAEAEEFFPEQHTEWETYEAQEFKLSGFVGWSPRRAKQAFLESFETYGGKV